MTPQDIITLALKDIGILGIGQTPNAEDSNDAFTKLNWMMAQWSSGAKRYLVYHLVDVSVVSTGAQSYTIGPGGDFNRTQRPSRLEAAFARQSPSGAIPIDYPLTVIPARETYNRISMKQLRSFPSYVWLDAAWPLGNVFVWPIPTATLFEIHLTVQELLPQFSSLSQMINLPPEYHAAIEQNLAIMLAPGYARPVDPGLMNLARNSLDVIRVASSQIPWMQMPDAVAQRGAYNIYSDQQQ